MEDDDVSLDSEFSVEGKLDSNNPDESLRFDRRNRRRGMLGWFKLKVIFSMDYKYNEERQSMLLSSIFCFHLAKGFALATADNSACIFLKRIIGGFIGYVLNQSIIKSVCFIHATSS